MTDAIWEKIDNHAGELDDVKKNIHGMSERMIVLENRFDSSIKNQAEGQARIETMLGCLQTTVTKLNDDKLIDEGYEKAKGEHFRLVKWLGGIFMALIASGALSIQFLSDKIKWKSSSGSENIFACFLFVKILPPRTQNKNKKKKGW